MLNLFNVTNHNERIKGINWYKDAHEWCKVTAQNYNLSVDTVAKVLSILSPANRWNRNKIETHGLIEAWTNGFNIDELTFCTYPSNVIKAVEVLAGIKDLEPKSLKTYAFYKNIMLDENFITVDRWHLRILFYKPLKSLTNARYKDIQDITIKLANSLGLKGYEFQSIIWEKARTQ